MQLLDTVLVEKKIYATQFKGITLIKEFEKNKLSKEYLNIDRQVYESIAIYNQEKELISPKNIESTTKIFYLDYFPYRNTDVTVLRDVDTNEYIPLTLKFRKEEFVLNNKVLKKIKSLGIFLYSYVEHEWQKRVGIVQGEFIKGFEVVFAGKENTFSLRTDDQQAPTTIDIKGYKFDKVTTIESSTIYCFSQDNVDVFSYDVLK
jgi:hypothetical protein